MPCYYTIVMKSKGRLLKCIGLALFTRNGNFRDYFKLSDMLARATVIDDRGVCFCKTVGLIIHWIFLMPVVHIYWIM